MSSTRFRTRSSSGPSSDPQEPGYFELRVAHGAEYGGYEPDDRWRHLRAEITPQEDVPDVGDDAFKSSDEVIFFRKGDQVLHTVANFGDDPSTAGWVVELVRRAARRI